MKTITRRALLRATASSAAVALGGQRIRGGVFLAAPKSTNIRIEHVEHSYQDFPYRTPYVFGGRAVDRVTLLNVHCVVRTADGRGAKGFGSMSLGNLWSFPSKTLSYDATLGAMKRLADQIKKITTDYKEAGHPIDINWELEPAYLRAADEVSRELALSEPIPKLCTLVTASPFDAAIHDAFAKAHKLSCYHTYTPDFMSHDIAHYLGSEFKGEYPSRYVASEPKPRLFVYHSVGAGDPIVESDITKRINDGLPETLPAWINHDGLTHFKIKLNGNHLQADLDRVVRIDRAATQTEEKRRVAQWKYSLDFNEQCPNVEFGQMPTRARAIWQSRNTLAVAQQSSASYALCTKAPFPRPPAGIGWRRHWSNFLDPDFLARNNFRLARLIQAQSSVTRSLRSWSRQVLVWRSSR